MVEKRIASTVGRPRRQCEEASWGDRWKGNKGYICRYYMPGNRITVCGDQEPVLLIKFGALGVLGQPLKTLSKCREEFSDDGKHERRPGLLTELHPGDLSCHCCNVGKTKAMTWAHWERGDQRIRNGESGPDNLNRRPRCERKCVCDLGGGASKVASQMVPR